MTKFFVDDADRAMIICPKCGFTKTVDTTNYKKTQKRLKAKCKCGEIFKFMLEFRKHYRKDVRLPGEYTVRQSRENGEIIIRNLSLTGIRFSCLRPHRISADDILDLKFNLDNTARTEIQRSAKVKWVDDREVGVQYIEPKLFERDLTFYLRS